MTTYIYTHTYVETLLEKYINILVSKFKENNIDVKIERIPPENMRAKKDTQPYVLNIEFEYFTYPEGYDNPTDGKPRILRKGDLSYCFIHNRDISFNPNVEKVLLERGTNRVYIHEALLPSVTTPKEVVDGKSLGVLFGLRLLNVETDNFIGYVDPELKHLLDKIIEIDTKYIDNFLTLPQSEFEESLRQLNLDKIDDCISEKSKT